MKTEQKLIGLKEIVIVVLLSALTVVIGMITAMPFMASPKWSVWGGYTLATLISGPVYVLMIAKSPKLGTNLLFFGTKSIYTMILGQIPTAIVYLLGGLICELITLSGGYKQPWRIGIAYTVHSILFSIGSFTPMFIGADAYAKQLLDSGLDQSIVNAMIYDLIAPSFVAISSLLLAIAAAVGITIGMSLLKKHFRPSGVA